LEVFVPHQEGQLAMLWKEFGGSRDPICACLGDKIMAASIMVE
jgi:hypothetical protein